MLPQPVPLLLLPDEVLKPGQELRLEDDVLQLEARVAQIDQRFEFAARFREWYGDACASRTKAARLIDCRAKLFRCRAMTLPSFGRRHLKDDRVELLVIAFSAAPQERQYLLGIRHLRYSLLLACH